MILHNIVEPKFFIGEIVEWNNKNNPRCLKIVSIYKLITDCDAVLFRYGCIKEVDNNTETAPHVEMKHLENIVFNLIFNENEIIKLNPFRTTNENNFEENLNKKFETYNPENYVLDIIHQ